MLLNFLSVTEAAAQTNTATAAALPVAAVVNSAFGFALGF